MSNTEDDINEKLNLIISKINNLEKTYVSINADLINQNIKISELLNGKLKEPEFNYPDNSNLNEDKVKELYYFIKNEQFVVYGPGTFDNKDKLKTCGTWNSLNKSWDLIISSKDDLVQKFPNIIFKEKIN
jgi:hypothetical protein